MLDEKGVVAALKEAYKNGGYRVAFAEGRVMIRWKRHNVLKVAQARGKLFDYIAEDEPIPEQLLTWYIDRVLPRPYAVGDVLWVRECWDFLPCIVCRPNSECCEIAPDAPSRKDCIKAGSRRSK